MFESVGPRTRRWRRYSLQAEGPALLAYEKGPHYWPTRKGPYGATDLQKRPVHYYVCANLGDTDRDTEITL